MSMLTFNWTAPALLAGAKTVTRRDWSTRHARQFQDGTFVDAWDCNPRNGGRRIARVRLIGTPAIEPLRAMPDADYEAEGWAYLHVHPECLPRTMFGQPCSREDFSWAAFCRWRDQPWNMYVVRFALEQVI